MTDHDRVYNIAVKDARNAHRYNVRKATEIYESESSPLLAAYEHALDVAAERFREAMSEAEDAYEQALMDADHEPPL